MALIEPIQAPLDQIYCSLHLNRVLHVYLSISMVVNFKEPSVSAALLVNSHNFREVSTEPGVRVD